MSGDVVVLNRSKYNEFKIKTIERLSEESVLSLVGKRIHFTWHNINKHTKWTMPGKVLSLKSNKLRVFTMDIIFDEEKLISKLPSKFRQNTRRSYRKGLRNNISKKVDLNNFYNLYLQTAQRHSFNPHTIDYFKNLINIYKENLIFLEVWYNDIPLAMSIDIIYNNKLIYLYGVSSTENRNLLGMYNMQWEAIKYCIKNQIPQYDFGGVFCEEDDINNKDYGLYNFKKGYCFKGFRDIVPDIVFNFEGSDIDD